MTGTEILANLNKPTVYIGEVKEIYKESDKNKDGAIKEPSSIRFTIPGVTDGVNKYLDARLIGNRTRRVDVGDTVLIIKQGSFNNIFFYMPMDISDFIGCAYDKDHYLKFNKDSISIKSNDSSITVGNDGITISNGENTVAINDGKVNISTKNGDNVSSISLSSDLIKSNLEISVAGTRGKEAAVSLVSGPVPMLNLGINSGGFIILPTGMVGFSTGFSVQSATVPVLPGQTPIITIPAIITVVIIPGTTQDIKVKLSGIEVQNGAIAFNEGDIVSIVTEPDSITPTIEFNGSTVTSGSIVASTGTLTITYP